MDAKIIAILIVCIVAVLTAGCTGGSAPPARTAIPTPPAPTPGVTTASADAQSCIAAEDCMTAQCCHPTSCTGKAAAPSCNNVMCTMSCESPLDCGAGSCRCVNGKCRVVPAQTSAGRTGQKVSVRLEVSPQRYSPIMSSTPGIGFTPKVTGFKAADAKFEGVATDFTWNAITFEWNATYGTFLMWDAPDYTVHQIGNPVATDGRTIYWTFTEKPASIKDPVTVRVTAKDSRSGAELGASTVTLEWDGDYVVYVKDIH